MPIDQLLAMKSDPALSESIRRAASKPLSQDEMLAQRVSFVFGSIDRENGVTRDRVREVILGIAGATGTTTETA